MPSKKGNRAVPVRKKRILPVLLSIFLAILIGLTGWMYLQARIVHIRYADVSIGDLPSEMDGLKILYITDIDLCGTNSVRHVEKLMHQLQELWPDVLLLGGDYASASLIDRLNGNTSAAEQSLRANLLKSFASFSAPLGKFAVSGDNDGNTDALRIAMQAGGIQLIDGQLCEIRRGGSKILIAGIGASVQNSSALSQKTSVEDCVIALSHSPEQAIAVRIAEARGGGSWTDLILSGHTHGGQVKLGDRTLLSLNAREKQYLSGWHTQSDSPLLVSQGLGCETVNLRLGTTAEVWLLTLRQKDSGFAFIPS